MAQAQWLNLPILLTLSRLILSPLLLPVLLVYLLPFNNIFINSFLGFLFFLFSITDFFDGYFARRYKQETQVGKLLDPIADKFLLYSTLIGLLAADKIFFYWVIIIIGREFFVMGLRQIAFCSSCFTVYESCVLWRWSKLGSF
jgi:CDP-diacylglycerol--glycerol-3-phosphate 3-phosphatidyltransferase